MTSKATELAIDQAALKRMTTAFVAARSKAGDVGGKVGGMTGVMDVYEEEVQAPLRTRLPAAWSKRC